MLQMLTHSVYAIPKEIVVPIVIGAVIAGFGLFFFPPTHHWDGKRSFDPPR